MKKTIIIIIQLLLISAICFSQKNKGIKKDSSVIRTHVGVNHKSFSNYNSLQQELKITDLQSTFNHFHFRLWTFGQAIDIWRDSSQILNGCITSYSYKINKKDNSRKRTIKRIDSLEVEGVIEAFQFIQRSKTLDDTGFRAIPNWIGSCDGYVYAIEHCNSKEYFFKSYNTPNEYEEKAKDDFVSKFIPQLEYLLKSQRLKTLHNRQLPSRGYFSYGGNYIFRHLDNWKELGYLANSEMNYGLRLDLYTSLFLGLQSESHTTIKYKTDLDKSYDLDIELRKYSDLTTKDQGNNNGTYLTYRQRKLIFLDSLNEFKNYGFSNGYLFPGVIDVDLGINFLKDSDKGKLGIKIGLDKYFNNNLSRFSLDTWTYYNQIDFALGFEKKFNFHKHNRIPYMMIRMEYEKFKSYYDTNVSLSIGF